MHKNRMTAEETLFELEPILYSITYGIQAVGAIHTAMAEGQSAPEGFYNALYYVWDKLTDDAGKAAAIVNGATEKCVAGPIIPADWPTFGEVVRQMEKNHAQQA